MQVKSPSQSSALSCLVAWTTPKHVCDRQELTNGKEISMDISPHTLEASPRDHIISQCHNMRHPFQQGLTFSALKSSISSVINISEPQRKTRDSDSEHNDQTQTSVNPSSVCKESSSSTSRNPLSDDLGNVRLLPSGPAMSSTKDFQPQNLIKESSLCQENPPQDPLLLAGCQDVQLPRQGRCHKRRNSEPREFSRWSCSEKMWCSLRSWVAISFIMILHVPNAMGQCDSLPPIVAISETDPAGTELLKVSAAGGTQWRWDVSLLPSWYQNYLNFSLDTTNNVYRMTLIKPLDLEEIVPLYNLTLPVNPLLRLLCRPAGSGELLSTVSVIVQHVNEFAPEFNQTSIVLTVSESVLMNETLITLHQWASDRDQNPQVREIAGYSFLPAPVDSQIDGIRWLVMSDSFNGIVRPRIQLDYEALPQNEKMVVVGVHVNDTSGLSGTSTLTINIEDADDLPPEFFYPGCTSPCQVTYSVTVSPNVTGPVTGIQPAAIKARDRDTLNYTVEYHIVQGPPGYEQYIAMDSASGDITITQELLASGFPSLVLIIEAREMSLLQHSTRTTLLVTVEGVSAGTSVTSASTGDDNTVMIVAIVLSILIVIIAVVLILCIIHYRERYKKSVHPEPSVAKRKEENHKPESTANEYTQGDRPSTLYLSDEGQMREEEELTWVPFAQTKDIVDLSDEETLRLKRKQNGIPPAGTKLANGDSAFEESDKKSTSDDSGRNFTNYPESEYAELDSPLGKPKEREPVIKLNSSSDPARANKVSLTDHVYNNSPSNIPVSGRSSDQTTAATAQAEDEEGQDVEYETPRSARFPDERTPSVIYNRAYRDHEVTKKQSQSPDGDNSSEGVTSFSARKRPNRKNSPSRVNDKGDVTEYSVPPSGRSSSYSNRPLPIPEDIDESRLTSIDFNQQRANVHDPQRIRAISGVKLPDEFEDVEDHYATVDKKRETPRDQADQGDADHSAQSSSAGNSPKAKTTPTPLQAPLRRKRPRKRTKSSREPNEEVFDGTKDDDDNWEVDSGFYTDTTKTRIKRSTRVPVMKPDPNDTRYWITVTDDY